MKSPTLNLPHRLILVMLGARDGQTVPDELWLQKELFYLGRDKPRIAQELDYIPYLKGPWSETVKAALEDLRTLGLVEYEPRFGRDIHLSDSGKRIYGSLARDIPETLREDVDEVKGLLNDLSENELLLFIYETYPDMTKGSVVKEKPIQDRVRYATNLYRKGKVSLERAAELAGLPLSEFRRKFAAA